MEFQAQWDATGYSAAMFDALRQHPWKAARGFWYPMAIVVLGIYVAIAHPERWQGALVCVAVGVGLAAVALALAAFRWRRVGKRLAQQPPLACTADGKGLVLRNANTVETHPWSDFDGFENTTVFFRLPHTGKAPALLLPKRLLSPAQDDQLASLLAACIGGERATVGR